MYKYLVSHLKWVGLFIKVTSILIVSRLLFLSFSILTAQIIPLRKGYLGSQLYPNVPDFVWIWANFDGRHFLRLATLNQQQFDFAFFPLYPLLISLANKFVPLLHIYWGIGISLISFSAAVFVIYKIVMFDYRLMTKRIRDDLALLAVVFLSFFPLSFFYQAVYADSLFLLLSSLSFYFARRGSWLWSGIFCFLTTLTRLSGVALLPALVVEWYLQNKKPLREWKLLAVDFAKNGMSMIILGVSGIFLYMAVLQFYFGDALLFQKAMIAWRQNEFIFPPQVIWRYLKIFWFVQKDMLVFWIAVLEFVSFFLYLALSIYVLKAIRISYGVLMVVLLLLVTFTGTFAGTPRYMLHLFPGFIGLAVLVNKYKFLQLPLLLLFAVLGFLFLGLFTRGYFVA